MEGGPSLAIPPCIVGGRLQGSSQRLREIDEALEFNYSKFYVGLQKEGRSNNFGLLRPRVEIKLDRSEETASEFEEAGLDPMPHSRTGRYRIRLSAPDMQVRPREFNSQRSEPRRAEEERLFQGTSRNQAIFRGGPDLRGSQYRDSVRY